MSNSNDPPSNPGASKPFKIVLKVSSKPTNDTSTPIPDTHMGTAFQTNGNTTFPSSTPLKVNKLVIKSSTSPNLNEESRVRSPRVITPGNTEDSYDPFATNFDTPSSASSITDSSTYAAKKRERPFSSMESPINIKRRKEEETGELVEGSEVLVSPFVVQQQTLIPTKPVSSTNSNVTSKRYIPIRKSLNNALKKLIDLDVYKFFYEPVKESEAPGYHSVIKHPMDFSTMRIKLNEDKYPYWSLFVHDFELICQNCIQFNAPESIFWNEAKTLLLEGRKYLKVQATKINPDLLKPPENSEAGSANSLNSGTSNRGKVGINNGISMGSSIDDNMMGQTARRILERPAKFYIPNSKIPFRLLAPPPPVDILPYDKLNDQGDALIVYPNVFPKVATGTPQEQDLIQTHTYSRFVLRPLHSQTTSHFGKANSSYLNYTRGYIPITDEYEQMDKDQMPLISIASKGHQSQPNSHIIPQLFHNHQLELLYKKKDKLRKQSRQIQSISEKIPNPILSRLSKCLEYLNSWNDSNNGDNQEAISSTSEKLEEIGEILDPLKVDTFDSSSLNTDLTPDLSVQLTQLQSEMKNSHHIDLSFLSKFFKTTKFQNQSSSSNRNPIENNTQNNNRSTNVNNNDTPSSQMAMMIDSNSALIQSFAHRSPGPYNESDIDKYIELSANLMTLVGSMSKNPSQSDQ